MKYYKVAKEELVSEIISAEEQVGEIVLTPEVAVKRYKRAVLLFKDWCEEYKNLIHDVNFDYVGGNISSSYFVIADSSEYGCERARVLAENLIWALQEENFHYEKPYCAKNFSIKVEAPEDIEINVYLSNWLDSSGAVVRLCIAHDNGRPELDLNYLESLIKMDSSTEDIEGKGVGPTEAIKDWVAKNAPKLKEHNLKVNIKNGVAELVDISTNKYVARFVPKRAEALEDKEYHGPEEARMFQRYFYVLKLQEGEIETAADWKDAETVLKDLINYNKENK